MTGSRAPFDQDGRFSHQFRSVLVRFFSMGPMVVYTGPYHASRLTTLSLGLGLVGGTRSHKPLSPVPSHKSQQHHTNKQPAPIMHPLHNTAPASPTFQKEDQKPIFPPLELLPLPCLAFARPQRRVCFDESANQSHVFERVTPEEYDDVWYRGGAMEHFRNERRVIASVIQEADQDNRWSQALLGVYCAFRQMDNPSDVANVLAATQIAMDEFTVGLEKHILPPLNRDFAVRRQHLLSQFYYLQHRCHYQSDEQREQLLRDTSLLSSRASRLFAQYCAQVAAECAGLEEHA